VIKADVGSVGGHLAPSKSVVDTVRRAVHERKKELLLDYCVGSTGDAVAILMTHRHGAAHSDIHRLAWEAFVEGAKVAKQQGLSGAGQDLLTQTFSGNVEGTGPDAAEMEIDERANESFLFFSSDKADPGVFNLPLYLAFADAMNTPGLVLSDSIGQGFRFQVTDLGQAAGRRILDLETPHRIYDLAALLRNPDRYVITSVWSRATDDHAAQVAASRRLNDDPVMLVRTQGNFPTTGEVLAPYAIGPLVGGGIHGSHQMPLMPVALATQTSFFDGPPLVSCAAFSVHDGRLTEPVDAFAHPFWDTVRQIVANKAIEIRRQGFVGASMHPMAESAYAGIAERLTKLDERFTRLVG
ncbi:MAG: fructose 1,6-bisphosphatase, partial [Lysobacterales bacterium]